MSISAITHGEKTIGKVSIPLLHHCYVLDDDKIYCVLEFLVKVVTEFSESGVMFKGKLDKLHITLPYEATHLEDGTPSLQNSQTQYLSFYSKSRKQNDSGKIYLEGINGIPFDSIKLKVTKGGIEISCNQGVFWPTPFAVRLRYETSMGKMKEGKKFLLLDYYEEQEEMSGIIDVEDLIVSLVFPGNIKVVGPDPSFDRQFDIKNFEIYESYFGSGRIGNVVKKFWMRDQVLHTMLWDLRTSRKDKAILHKPPPFMAAQSFSCAYLSYPAVGASGRKAEFVIYERGKTQYPATLNDISALKENSRIALLMDEDDNLYICGEDRSSDFERKFAAGPLLRLFIRGMGSAYREEIEDLLEQVRKRREDNVGVLLNYKRSLRYVEDLLFSLGLKKFTTRYDNKNIFVSSGDRVNINRGYRIALIRRKEDDFNLHNLR